PATASNPAAASKPSAASSSAATPRPAATSRPAAPSPADSPSPPVAASAVAAGRPPSVPAAAPGGMKTAPMTQLPDLGNLGQNRRAALTQPMTRSAARSEPAPAMPGLRFEPPPQERKGP